ncbi:hypothetical protein BG452_04820 [Streptomyces sp. CBMA123]|nr:hypothetical protein [Streptomyces sp. CBMA123]
MHQASVPERGRRGGDSFDTDAGRRMPAVAQPGRTAGLGGLCLFVGFRRLAGAGQDGVEIGPEEKFETGCGLGTGAGVARPPEAGTGGVRGPLDNAPTPSAGGHLGGLAVELHRSVSFLVLVLVLFDRTGA